jgi:hypothetical protein
VECRTSEIGKIVMRASSFRERSFTTHRWSNWAPPDLYVGVAVCNLALPHLVRYGGRALRRPPPADLSRLRI